jgi:hypothetical protein
MGQHERFASRWMVPAVIAVTAAASVITGSSAWAGKSSQSSTRCRRDCTATAPTTTTTTAPPVATVADSTTTTTAPTTTIAPTPTTSPATAPAPASTSAWTSPEGVRIEVNTAGSWTVAQVYDMLRANARDLDLIGPRLVVKVQDQYPTSATSSTGDTFNAVMWLHGTSGAFVWRPNDTIAHEYGHVWSWYFLETIHGGDWEAYLVARGIRGDPRLGSSHSWSVNELMADDYRLLLGTASAIKERPWHLNQELPDPRNMPAMRDFLVGSWAAR